MVIIQKVYTKKNMSLKQIFEKKIIFTRDPRKIDIKEVMSEKTFFNVITKNHRFPRKINTEGVMSEKRFTKKKKLFFTFDHKKSYT